MSNRDKYFLTATMYFIVIAATTDGGLGYFTAAVCGILLFFWTRKEGE